MSYPSKWLAALQDKILVMKRQNESKYRKIKEMKWLEAHVAEKVWSPCLAMLQDVFLMLAKF